MRGVGRESVGTSYEALEGGFINASPIIKLNTIVFMNTELNTGVIKVFELKYPGYKSFWLEYSYLLRPHYS